MQGARKMPTVTARVPDELHSWLKHAAVDNRRSLGGELLVRLEESRKQQLSKSQGVQQ